MIQIAKKEEIVDYFNSPDLGQSKLKKLLSGISNFHTEEDSKANHFVIGSAVDCYLTGNAEDFEETFYISTVSKKPSDTVVEILNLVHIMLINDYAEYINVVDPLQFKEDHFEVIQDSLEEVPAKTSFIDFVGTLKNWEAYILEACKIVDWNRTWGDAAKFKNIVTEDNEAYFLDLCKAYGKTILDTAQKELIDNIVKSLQNNPRTRDYFDREALAENTSIQVFYQFPIPFTYRGQKCKALLDIVIVQRDMDGEILSVQGIDLKTTYENTYNFLSVLKTRRYDIQAAWYTIALQDYFAISINKVLPFMFIVESTTYVGKPLVYVLSESLLKIGKQGRKAISLVETNLVGEFNTAIIQRDIKGVDQLLDLYIYHNENGWSEEKEIKEQSLGEALEIDWDGFVTK